MKNFFFTIFLLFSVKLGFIQVFPSEAMDGDDYIYRSFYLSEAIQKLKILFQAGTYGKTSAYITLSFPKYIESSYEVNDTQNYTYPKSLGVETTILLKNQTNDSILWAMDESKNFRSLNLYPTYNYFSSNGIESERNDLNGVKSKCYTLTIIFLIQATELNIRQNVGKLTGIVTLFMQNSTTASTSLQTVLLNSRQNTSTINISIPVSLSTCFSETDCGTSPTKYKLNEDAIFRIKLEDEQLYNTYYLKNLVVSMSADSGPAIDVTSVITILSSSHTLGEVIFKLPIIMIPENYITISGQATLISSSRILSAEVGNQTIIAVTTVSVGEDFDKKEVGNTNYLTSLLLIGTLLFLLLYI